MSTLSSVIIDTHPLPAKQAALFTTLRGRQVRRGQEGDTGGRTRDQVVVTTYGSRSWCWPGIH